MDTGRVRNSTRVDRLVVVAVVVTSSVGVGFASMMLRGRPLAVYYDLFLFHNGPPAVILAWLGLVVLRRQPGNGAGRVLVTIAILSALLTVLAALADVRLVAAGYLSPVFEYAADVRMADLPLDAALLVLVMNFLWVPAPVLMIAILPLIFPDGRLPSRRWRWVPVTAAVGGATLVAAFVVDTWPTSTWTADEAPEIIGLLIAVGGLCVLAAAIGGFVALVIRWHRADRDGRRPFQVVGVAAGILMLVVVATYPWQHVWIPTLLMAWYTMLGAYALAVARYGVHEIEPFLGRAAVAAIVSVLIAGVYAAIVVGVGILVGRPFDDPVLPIVALAAVVLVVEPARRRSRRLVDRWLYGARTDRIEVMSRVAAHGNTPTTAADVLREVTELLVRSTGAARAEAWLDADPSGPTAMAGTGGNLGQCILAVDIAHHGERFGELRLFARVPADLVRDAPDLLADVAHAVGIVVHNQQLAAQLQTQLVELQTSRQRLVEAHERGRRSLERDIHDGAQSRLIALRLRIGVAQARHGHTDTGLATEFDELAHETDEAVRSLRDLARGLAPPLLDEYGLAASLRAHTRTLPIPVTVTAHDVVRYPAHIESAAYFCCLEAIQNAVRHGGAATITVDLDGDASALRFHVVDDGVGFESDSTRRGAGLANIGDRIAALGGKSCVDSAPGNGTTVVGSIPVQPEFGASVVADR